MTDEVINSIPFPNAHVYDKTLTRLRKREIDELIVSRGMNPKLFTWEEQISSKFQRPDVRVSRLVVQGTDFYFLFNSTREGSMFFTRCPGLNSKVEDGETGHWPYQIAAVHEWLTALKAEVEEQKDLRLELQDGISGTEFDALLKIYQRGVFNQDLQAFTGQSMEAGNPLALIMCDIDKFKQVNDTYGHPAGDEVLQFVANTVKKTSTGKGKTYRYGGEELAVLLPNYTAEEAGSLAERIRREVELALIGHKQIRTTVSCGVSELPAHAATAEALVEAADVALYAAKNLGRNLVRISGELAPERQPITRRRQPDPSALSDSEVEQILSDYFRYHSAFCPKDGSHLEVDEIRSDERVTVDLIITCPRCGLEERIDSPTR